MGGETFLAAVLSVATVIAAVFFVVELAGDLAVLGDGMAVVGWMVAVAAATALVAAVRGRWRAHAALRGAMTGRADVHEHGPASRGQREIGRHEVGHVVGAEETGMGVRSVKIGDGWGYVQAARFVSVQASITFLAAGHLAVGTKRGASADLAAIRDLARNLPRETRARDLRAAIDEARRITGQQQSRIRRDGHRLADTGRWAA